MPHFCIHSIMIMLRLLLEMRKIKKLFYFGIPVLIFVALILSIFTPSKAYADSPSIIINEIMYHPQSEVDADEFLEIHNTTGSTIDLTGWCFTAGINLCFANGTTIAAGAYAVVSPNASQTLTTYNVTTIGTYTGKLDNGGETLTLRDGSSNIINSLTYDDVPPWPTTPDGSGPSLALKNPAADNTVATSWGACPCGASPGAVNVLFTAGLPDILNLSTPEDVTASTSPTITVDVTNAESVNLVYKVMFGAEQTLPMYDDGVHGDGAAFDGKYGATIPVQQAGKLVRYKVTATNNDGTQSKPGGSDTINYQGYVVQDPAAVSQLPVFQWFIEDSEYAALLADRDEPNPWEDPTNYECVIAVGNTVIDNAGVHVYGQGSRDDAKANLAVDLPKGYKIQIPGKMDRAVDEFHLDNNMQSVSPVSSELSWKLAEIAGIDTVQNFTSQVRRNGSFHGIFTFTEEHDKTWREEFGYEGNGIFYKDSTFPKDMIPTDGSDPDYSVIIAYQAAIEATQSQDRLNYILDNQNIPNTINLMAFESILQNDDWGIARNIDMSHDERTGRYTFLPWDLDGSFYSRRNPISPYNVIDYGGSSTRQRLRYFVTSLYDEPAYRELYFRRLRTLIDQIYKDDQINSLFDEYFNKISNEELAQEHSLWGSYNAADRESVRAAFLNNLKELKKTFLSRYKLDWAVPNSQSGSPVVDIDDINNSLTPNEGYVKLTNNSNEVIDMSGWSVPELGYELPAGSVIGPGMSVYIVRDDPTFKLANNGRYILGEFSQDLSSVFGNSLTLQRSDNTISDTRLY